MNYEIRKATSEDEKSVKEMIKQFKLFEAQYEDAYRVSEEAIQEIYDLEFADKEKYAYVAVFEGNIIGLITFEKSEKNDPLIVDHVDTVYIGMLFVAPEYRGKGIASALMKLPEEYARAEKIQFLKLILFAKNQLAHDYYKQKGFEEYEYIMVKKL